MRNFRVSRSSGRMGMRMAVEFNNIDKTRFYTIHSNAQTNFSDDITNFDLEWQISEFLLFG